MGDELQQVKQVVGEMESRFDHAMQRLTECLDRQATNSSHSTITFNAGGLGVWLAASACAVMLAVNMVLVVVIASHDRKIDDLSHYLNAIYMIAPQLKPEDK